MKLSQLKEGEKAYILEFSELSNQIKKKLMIMGLLPNTEVTVIRRAPLGDPIQIRVRGTSLAVRDKMADSIVVEKL